jgi:hypothetical protein
MSKEKLKKKNRNYGGRRVGAGAKPRPGGTIKKCVSVCEQTWQAADELWKKKPSWLIDGLLSCYVKSGGSILNMEAAK